MDYKKIIGETFFSVIVGTIVVSLIGGTLLIINTFEKGFEQFTVLDEFSFQLAIAVFSILIILIFCLTLIRNIIIGSRDTISRKNNEVENTILNKEKELRIWRDQNLSSFNERELKINIERDQILKLKSNMENVIKENSQSYPWISKLYSDFVYVNDEKIAEALLTKLHPAEKAAQQVSAIAKEKRDLQKLCKMLEYQLNYYENVFPWLEEFKEVEPIAAWEMIHENDNDDTSEYDKVKSWLSPDDYNNLPSAEKWQLALNRYCKKRKTSWEIGIGYERYVGYCYEIAGYKVKYQGALLGLEDMGRDVIVVKKDETLVIQCKRWSKEKTIHEKHIFQLYGSVVLLRTQNPKKNFKGVFVTTTKLSDTAKECAEYLGIEVVEEYLLKDYPMIKCNNTTKSGMIYHLPFDQQYDRVQINPSDGDVYLKAVEQAENLGFRHTYKWHGTE